MDEDEFLTAEQVSMVTKVSRGTLHAWAAEADAGGPAKGPAHYNLGRKRMWRAGDVAEWLAARRVG